MNRSILVLSDHLEEVNDVLRVYPSAFVFIRYLFPSVQKDVEVQLELLHDQYVIWVLLREPFNDLFRQLLEVTILFDLENLFIDFPFHIKPSKCIKLGVSLDILLILPLIELDQVGDHKYSVNYDLKEVTLIDFPPPHVQLIGLGLLTKRAKHIGADKYLIRARKHNYEKWEEKGK